MYGNAAWDLNGFYQFTHSLSSDSAAATITLNGGTMELGGGGQYGSWSRNYQGLLVDGRAPGTVIVNLVGRTENGTAPGNNPYWNGLQTFNCAAGSTVGNLILEHGSVGGGGGLNVTGSINLQAGTLVMPLSGSATTTKTTTGTFILNAANVLSSSCSADGCRRRPEPGGHG